MKVKVIDVMREPENEPGTMVSVEGTAGNHSAFHMPYYAGELQNIPEYLQNCEVLKTGWLMRAKRYIIEIPFLMNSERYDPNRLTYEEQKAGVTIEDKQREIKAYYEIMESCDEIEATLKGSARE